MLGTPLPSTGTKSTVQTNRLLFIKNLNTTRAWCSQQFSSCVLTLMHNEYQSTTYQLYPDNRSHHHRGNADSLGPYPSSVLTGCSLPPLLSSLLSRATLCSARPRNIFWEKHGAADSSVPQAWCCFGNHTTCPCF